MPDRAGHRQLDHTADLALELWAPTESELLAEAARALTAILTEDSPPDATGSRRVALAALDGPDRLVRWMNEILTLAIVEGFVTVTARVDLEGETGLRAELTGHPLAFDRVRTELKCVTYHDLALEQEAGTWRARVVIDV